MSDITYREELVKRIAYRLDRSVEGVEPLLAATPGTAALLERVQAPVENAADAIIESWATAHLDAFLESHW